METPAYEYVVGGDLKSQVLSYVARQTDEELYQALKAGELCYLLNSRQMGKSSLKNRTIQKLREDGVICSAIDLQGMGSAGMTLEAWYAGIIRWLVKDCGLGAKFNWKEWWKASKEQTSPVQKLQEFIDEVLLVEIPHSIVVFIDEVDLVLKQNFSLDDFFGLIRFCHNRRAEDERYSRLTFALLGVATPADLIKDKVRSPFNVGRAIELRGFQFDDKMEPLIEGLVGIAANPQAVMREILSWTGGQPFLTQKLCKLVRDQHETIPNGQETVWVKRLVQLNIIENWEEQDHPDHLKTIRDRILHNEKLKPWLLGQYQAILQQGKVESEDSLEVMQFCLTGLIVKRGNELKAYNQVYRSVFNEAWVSSELKNIRPYNDSFVKWEATSHSPLHLLQGKELDIALQWSQKIKLSNRDYRYLADSQNKALAETQQKEKLAAEELTKALNEVRKSKKRSILWSLTAAGAIGAIGISIAILTTSLSSLIGWTLTENGYSNLAVNFYNLALLPNPTNERVKFQQGIAYVNLTDYHNAKDNFISLLSSQDPNIKSLSYSSLAYVDIHKGDQADSPIAQSQFYIEAKKNSLNALKIYESLENSSNKENSIHEKYNILKNLAWSQLRLKEYNSARKNLFQAINLNSSRPSAHCLMAQTFEEELNNQSFDYWKKCDSLIDNDDPRSDKIDKEKWKNEAKRQFHSNQ